MVSSLPHRAGEPLWVIGVTAWHILHSNLPKASTGYGQLGRPDRQRRLLRPSLGLPERRWGLAVRLRDVLGALDDHHGLGQDASIGWWPMSGVGEAPVSRQALADDLLGRAPAQHALAAGVVG